MFQYYDFNQSNGFKYPTLEFQDYRVISPLLLQKTDPLPTETITKEEDPKPKEKEKKRKLEEEQEDLEPLSSSDSESENEEDREEFGKPKPRKYSARNNWKRKEDDVILKMMKEEGNTPGIWGKIASKLKTRTITQCYQRYNRVINPTLDKSHFSPSELETLEKEYENGKVYWADIAKQFKNRSDVQCRSELKRLIHSKKFDWEPLEDHNLKSLVLRLDKYKFKEERIWVLISEQFNSLFHNLNMTPKRTSLDCKRRCEELKLLDFV